MPSNRPEMRRRRPKSEEEFIEGAARKQEGEEDYVRLNLEVPRRLRAELQKRAIDEGLTMRELGTKILKAYLERVNG